MSQRNRRDVPCIVIVPTLLTAAATVFLRASGSPIWPGNSALIIDALFRISPVLPTAAPVHKMDLACPRQATSGTSGVLWVIIGAAYRAEMDQIYG